MTVKEFSKNKVTLELGENEVIDSEQVLNNVSGVAQGGIVIPVFTTAGTVQTSGNGTDDWEPADLDALASSVNFRRFIRCTAAADVEFVIV